MEGKDASAEWEMEQEDEGRLLWVHEEDDWLDLFIEKIVGFASNKKGSDPQLSSTIYLSRWVRINYWHGL